MVPSGISQSSSPVRASTGEVVWHFQMVHHDLWDYDLASPPALITISRNGERIPAVVQGTKMGYLYILHRETGEPLFPVVEQPVPASDVPGWPGQLNRCHCFPGRLGRKDFPRTMPGA